MITSCFNPHCLNTHNLNTDNFCINCGQNLILQKRYRALQILGKSNCSRTFLAIDENNVSKLLCIKQFLHPDKRNHQPQQLADLFCRKALRLKRLENHPQIPNLLDYFIQDNYYYLLYEFIDGQPLTEELLDLGTFTEAQIRQLLKDILPILNIFQKENIIHSDIKPENIIRRRRDRKLFLVDLGASWLMTEDFQVSQTKIIGNPQYAAPEQIMGKAMFASDLYSLGVTCIHLLTFVDPFDLFNSRENTWVWRDFLVNNPVSHQLGYVLDKLIQPSINQRYESVAAVLTDLEPQPINWLEYTPSSQIQWREKSDTMIFWKDIKKK